MLKDFSAVNYAVRAVTAHAPLVLWVIILISGVVLIKKLLDCLLTLIAKRYSESTAIIVGNCFPAASSFAKETARRQSGVTLIGTVGCDLSGEVGCRYLGGFEDFEKILDSHRPGSVIFSFDLFEKSKIIRLVNLCDNRCIKVYFLPAVYGYFKSARQVESLGSTLLIGLHGTPLEKPLNLILKRVLDIIGSMALIILTLPLMIFIAVLVRADSPGPIIFRQVRVGARGRKFRMLKFRSMRVSEERETVTWSTGVDERKTKLGNFLRRTSLDELPQLFNVLTGTMSLVGPRPEIPHFVDYFKDKIPLYMIKHYVKPGITGLAQIKGLRGDTSIEDRIDCDIYYIENWSIWLDLKILLKTPFKSINKNEKLGKKGEK